jgi:hypothetical protein
MQNVSRKSFLQTLTLGGGSLLTVGLADKAEAQQAAGSGGQTASLKSDAFTLTLATTPTGLNAHLVHVPTNTILADGAYSYDFGPLALSLGDHDDTSATFKGTTDTGLELTHTFRLPSGSPWLEEEISIKNTTPQTVSESFRCGFVLPVKPDTLPKYVFTAVPFRREPRDGSHGYQDFALSDILYQKRRTSLREDASPMRVHEDYLSEGWAATDGKNGFLFSKYNQTAREFSILDNVPAQGALTGLRWGGAGLDLASCEGMCTIPAGATHSFGSSRITSFQGDLTQGFYAFRSEMESRGMGVPADYNPPVHWNELYDNKLWWTQDPGGQDNPDNRKKYYTVDELKLEAAKAKAMGCEALYCDPGWDTNFASKIWDTARLGKVEDFVALLKNDYGLKLSLHTPLSGWCNPSSYPPECFRTDKAGNREGSLCGASKQYIDETVKRLNVLAAAGVVYFMFDGTAYNGDPCWDPAHGHPLPLTMAAHVDGTNLIACKVHETYPKVSIEMHDQVMGGAPYRFVPLYYGYGRNALGTSPALGFDTVWAFEMMWDPMSNLVSGQTILLYYYNLAYSLPLYLHIDLRGDNEQAVVFWWNASTIRYLGMGGTHTNPKVNDAHTAAMKDYIRLKPFYTAGTFYGLAENVHVHKHPADNAVVMNCFNVQGGQQPTIRFEPAQVGLKPDKKYKFSFGTFTQDGAAYMSTLNLPNMGHQLIEVTEA